MTLQFNELVPLVWAWVYQKHLGYIHGQESKQTLHILFYRDIYKCGLVDI